MTGLQRSNPRVSTRETQLSDRQSLGEGRVGTDQIKKRFVDLRLLLKVSHVVINFRQFMRRATIFIRRRDED